MENLKKIFRLMQQASMFEKPAFAEALAGVLIDEIEDMDKRLKQLEAK